VTAERPAAVVDGGRPSRDAVAQVAPAVPTVAAVHRAARPRGSGAALRQVHGGAAR